MTLAEFIRHIVKKGCEHKPIEGGNLTGIGVRLFNPQNKRTYYLQIYTGGNPFRQNNYGCL